MSRVRDLMARWWTSARVADLEAQLAAAQADNERLMKNLSAVSVTLAALRAEVKKARQDADDAWGRETRATLRLRDVERKLAGPAVPHDCGAVVDQLRRNLARAEQTIDGLRRDRERLLTQIDADAGVIDPDLVVAS